MTFDKLSFGWHRCAIALTIRVENPAKLWW